MKRREFITLLGGAAAAWPRAARAQQSGQVRRIGVLFGLRDSDALGQSYLRAFRRGLRDLHWIDGENIRIDVRWGGDKADLIQSYAAEIVAFKPDVILSHSGLVLPALRAATRTIPIIFTQIADPLASGLVDSLARPGGNITGFSNPELSMNGKMLQVMKEIAPAINRAAVILNPELSTQAGRLRAIEDAASSVGLPVRATNVSDGAELEKSINALADLPNIGVVVLPSPVTNRYRDRIIALMAMHRLPAIYSYRYFVTAGGLVSYGERPDHAFSAAALYVDRILRGEKPGDLPVQQPTMFELVVNLNTAKAIGLTVPESFLLRADEVIE